MPGYPCCCEESPSHEVGFPCPTCSGDKPRFMTLEIEGVENDPDAIGTPCTQCHRINQPYELEQDFSITCMLLPEDCDCLWALLDPGVKYCPENEPFGPGDIGVISFAVCWNTIDNVIRLLACIESVIPAGSPANFKLLFSRTIPSTSPPDCMDFNRLELFLDQDLSFHCDNANVRCFVTSGVLA